MAAAVAGREAVGMHSESRLPFLDGLRLAAFALLIPYHVGMYYVSWDWHVKSALAGPTIEPLMLLSSPWRLGLLFLVAGAACQGLWQRRGGWGFMRERSRRLLLPLLFGMAVIVTPQAYFEVLTKAPQLLPGDGGYLDFWAAYLRGGRYCRGQDCMDVPTWNHLWFLPYLWVYALFAALMLAWRRPETVTRAVWPDWAWLLLPALPLVLARQWLMPLFPSSHDLWTDFYNHAQYGYLFALGWGSRSIWPGLWQAALRYRALSLGLALAAWALLIVYFQAYETVEPPAALRALMRGLWRLMAWWAILAACGWAQRVFRENKPWLRAASQGVLCAYVLHQSLIVVFSQWLKPLAWPPLLEGLALIGLTALACAVLYRLLRPLPLLRELVGITAGSARPPRCSAPNPAHSVPLSG